MKFFRLIWKNVFRKKLRTTLTASSIVLVLVLIVILTSLLEAMQADPSGGRGANRLVVQHATGLGNFLPLSQLQRIEQIPGVVAVSPETWFGGVYKDDKPENWIGQLSADPEIYFDKIFDDATVDPAVNAEWKATRNGFVAGQKIAEKHGWKKGDHIILKGTYIPLNLDLVYIGSYNAGDETNIFFHNEYLNQSDWFGANKVTGIYYLKVDSGENVPRVAAAIDAMFQNSDAPTKTLTEKQFQLQFMEMMGNVKFLINGISLIILFAVTLIVANTVAMSARERVTEIAVMRTLGFGRDHILGFILSESVLMSLLGGALGVLLAKYFFIPAARGRGQQDLDLDLAGQLQGQRRHAGDGLRRLGRRRDPRGVRPGRAVVPAQHRRRSAEGGLAMAIPLKYNLRNLAARKMSTGMTAFVIGLVTAVFLCVLGLIQGVTRTLSVSASTRNVIAMRIGSQAEMQSVITREQADQIQALQGPERNAAGKPYVSPELLTLINVPRADGKTFSNVQVRGMAPIGMEIRPGVKIVDGRMFNPATNEAIVSRKLAKRFASMKVGETLATGSFRWVIVGLFDADGSAYESEIWTDVSDLQQQTKRNIVSTVFVRTAGRRRGGQLHRDDQRRPAAEARGQDGAQVFRRADDHGGPDQGARLHRRPLHGHRRFLRRHEHDVRAGFGSDQGDRDAPGDRLLAPVDPALLRARGHRAVPDRRPARNRVHVPRLQSRPDAPHGHDELPDVFGGALQLPDDARAHHGGARLRPRDGHPRRTVPGVPRGAAEDHDRAAGGLS